jgi:hypothetical protein
MHGESPDSQSSPSTLTLIAQYSAYYLTWLIICAIGLWLVFLIRDNLVEDIFFMRVNAWQLRAIDRWSVYILGALWFVSVFLVEGYLRRALAQGRFLVTAGRVLGAELILVVLSLLINAS